MSYLEAPSGKRVGVRSISNHLGVGDGTAYRAKLKIAASLKLGHVVGTIRVKSQKVAIEG